MSSTIFFFVFIPLLAIILLAVNLIFAPHNPYQEKDSAFECGFHSFLGQNRTQFSISFFIFALLFLLFDLEILLVYPYVVSAYTNAIYGLVIMLIFFLALTLGFAFELGKNALKIYSKQMFILNNNNSNLVTIISGFKNIFVYIKRHFTFKNCLVAFISLSLIILLRYIINGGLITNPLEWKDAYQLGIPSIILKLSVKAFVDYIFEEYDFEEWIFTIWNGPNKDLNKIKMGYNIIVDKNSPYKTYNTMESAENNQAGGERAGNRSRSNTPLENSVDYWIDQCKLYIDAIESLDKENNMLTSDQKYAKTQFLKINKYNLISLQEGLAESKRNVDLPTDSETIRKVKLLNELMRDAELRTPAFASFVERQKITERNSSAILEVISREKVIIQTALRKMYKIIDYNTLNKKSIPINGIIPGFSNSQLTESEINTIIDIINKDANAPLNVRNKIIYNTLIGNITKDSEFIKYFEKKSK